MCRRRRRTVSQKGDEVLSKSYICMGLAPAVGSSFDFFSSEP